MTTGTLRDELIPAAAIPRLAAGARVGFDRHGFGSVLLAPEEVLPLNATAAAILELSDGQRSIEEIAATLAARYRKNPAAIGAAIQRFLARLQDQALVDVRLPSGESVLPVASTEGEGLARREQPAAGAARQAGTPRPLALLAELTYHCPLRCLYCSNPTRLPGRPNELTTAEWYRVLQEAGQLGVLHVNFSGGEPLLRRDLLELVGAGRTAGLYTNLLTSGIGLTRDRAEQLRSAGLDSIQLSFQADGARLAAAIAGVEALDRKIEAARAVREAGLPLSLNVVVHRGNLERIDAFVALAEELGARRLELANVQVYGWALLNRDALLPTRPQVEQARAAVSRARTRLRGRMRILYVPPDYLEPWPKPCMNGWGARHLTVNPVGDVLPCPTASEIPSLRFANVRDQSLAWIWANSEAFNRFRGTDWLPEPCRSCVRREVDFGGCRCQAAMLTGDPGNTDPACALAPHHQEMLRAVERAAQAPIFPPHPLADARLHLPLHYRMNPPGLAE